MLFDLNDFDETLPGPFEWDVKRLAGERRGRRAQHRRRATRSARKIAHGRRARPTGRRSASSPTQAEPRGLVRADRRRRLPARARRDRSARRRSKRTQSTVKKARSRDHLRSVEKLTEVVDGRRRFLSDPPLVTTLEELLGDAGRGVFRAAMGELVRAYQASLQPDRRHLLGQYRLIDMARKVVGVGSVGTRAWILLLQGVDEDDLLILQAKEAQASVLEQFLGRQRVHAVRAAGGRGPAAHAGGERRDARLAADAGDRRRRARLLHPPAARLEGLGGHRGDAAGGLQPVRRAVRVDAGPRARPVGRPGRDRGRTSAARRRPTRRSPTSPRRTPTAPSRTTAALVAAIGSGRLEAVHGV